MAKKFILISLFFFNTQTFAVATGYCDANESSYEAYCSSFHDNETACRMNAHLCSWTAIPTENGRCEPLNGDVSYMAYCNAFDGNELACSGNSHLCRWFAH